MGFALMVAPDVRADWEVVAAIGWVVDAAEMGKAIGER
jgi:hypothetical protein